MKNKTFLSIVALILLIWALQNVSAGVYYTYDSYNNEGALYVGTRPDPYYGNYNYNYNYGNYGSYGNYGNYGYATYRNVKPIGYYRTCYDYDYEDLEWDKNPVCTWIENGDGWRDEYKRARAAIWVTNSYDARYNAVYGETSGEAFYYGDESASSNPSDWRNKPAYDPRIYGSNGDSYYTPRYDPETNTWNWRY